MREGVVVVVPTLAEGECRHPFVVARSVAAVVGHGAPAVGGGIHQPGDVIDEHQAQGDAPEHQGPAPGTSDAADPEQQSRQGQLKRQEPVVQPAVVRVLGQVAGHARHGLHGRDWFEHPAHVAPPEASMAVVVISIRIGELVVMAVQSHPVDWAVLAAEGPAGGEEALQPLRQLEGAVRQQAVVADGDAEAGGDPIENQQAGNGLPAPEDGCQSQQAEGMNHDHESDRGPVLAALSGHVLFAFAGLVQQGCQLQGAVRGCGTAGR